MNRNVQIEVMVAQEQSAVSALLRAQLDEHQIPLDQAGLERSVAEVVLRPERGTILVAKQAGQGLGPSHDIVGMAFLVYLWTPELGGLVARLEELYVLPVLRGHGLGEQLVRASLAEARRVGCVAVDLEVEHSHARAANLYERLGFGVLPRRVFRRDLSRE